MSLEFHFDYLLWSIAVALDAYRDHLCFHREHNDGYFSLHTIDTFDAWHHSKLIFWGCIMAGFIWAKPLDTTLETIAVFALSNFWIHEGLLHFGFRMLDYYTFEECMDLYMIKWGHRLEAIKNFLRIK